MYKLFAVLSAAFLMLVSSLTVNAAKAPGSHLLATASAGGTFFPVGVSIATMSMLKVPSITLSAITSAGSGENIKLMRQKEAMFGIVQALYGAYAWNGEGPFSEPQRFVRSVTMLWRNYEHFVVRKDLVRTGTIGDMRVFENASNSSKYRFSIGKKNSGTEGSGRHILSAIGLNPDRMNFVHKGYGATSNDFQDGKIGGMNITAGIPVSAVTMAFSKFSGSNSSARPVVLEYTDAQLAKINKKYPIWSRQTIPAGKYPGQTQDIQTIAQPTLLIVHEDVDQGQVRDLTKGIYENLAFLRSIHSATSEMSLQSAVEGLPVPLHSGAASYYSEQGIMIPYNLLR